MKILYRLIKAIYVFLLFLGLIWGSIIWDSTSPAISYTYGNYLVSCANGYKFDPTSKPLSYWRGDPSPETYTDDAYVKSECKYHTSYFPNDVAEVKYKLTYDTYPHVITSQEDQITSTLTAVFIYYLFLEIVRRTFMYIFFGIPFITRKK